MSEQGPFYCIPRDTGRAINLEYGSKIALFDADPDSYILAAILPDGERQAIGLSIEGAAAVYLLFLEEMRAGKLGAGIAKIKSRNTPKEETNA